MDAQDGIAIIGIAGRFPGADNVDEFWKNLLDGKDSISRFTDEQLQKHIENYNRLKNNPDYVKAKGIIENIEYFDAAFFGINPNEAMTMDPQQRIWLETVWDAFENAGCNPFSYKGVIGVYAGALPNTYLYNNILKNPELKDSFNSTYSMDSFQLIINNDPGYIATKTAYKFNLKGPAINVQTACSTSLVAVAQACQSLVNFESDMCVAGAVSVSLPYLSGYVYQKGAINSKNGQCRPFDIESNGTVASNGSAVVILKRLEDAVNDKDHIYAVLKGWATNNDGNNKVSFLAPSVDGQAEAIMMAQAYAEIDPEEISYIEAHGTATPLGDPIEIAALTKAFRKKTAKKQFCAIGSVKSNIGHIDVAAGVAGLIKASLSAYHKIIPQSIHFNEPNPKIDFENSPFYVQKEKTEWKNTKVLNMGISSFGIGGTNAHVIIQEPPATKKTNQKDTRPQLIPLSAKSEFSLNKRKKDFIRFLKENKNTDINELAYTLQTGRNHMPLRSYLVATSTSILSEEQVFNDYIDIGISEKERKIAFLFPGQGAQYINMGKDLYLNEPFCKNIYNQCFGIYKETTGNDLQEIIFPEKITEESEQILARTEFAQPALFITELAVARFLNEFGIKPDAMIGHSIGEFTAACISGVLSVEDALKIVIKRGQLMQKMREGSMFAVKTDAEKLEGLNSDLFEIAAVNAPDLCVISVQNENIKNTRKLLDDHSVESVLLNTSHAFHSKAFEPILEEFAEYVSVFKLNPVQIPYVSCLTGEIIDQKNAGDPEYYSKQLRNPVLFSKGISTITDNEDWIFIEVGPNTHLTSLVKRNNKKAGKSPVFPTLSKPDNKNEQEKLTGVIGRLWATGNNINFNSFYKEQPYKIVLPTYPFERKRYWIESNILDEKEQNNPTGSEVPEYEIHRETGIIEKESTLSVLKKILIDLTGFDENTIQPNETFSDMGIESLYLTQYASLIEKKFRLRIEFRQLIYDYPNLTTLSEFIKLNSEVVKTLKKKEPVRQKIRKNLIPFKPDGSGIPLVFVHGDNCDNFLPKGLDKDQPYISFIHLGSDGEQIKYKNVQQLARYYIKQLHEYEPEGPYILGGHSFGGIVAYEMAVQLNEQGYSIPLLILSDSIIKEYVPLFAFKRGIKARFRETLFWYFCQSFFKIKRTLPARLRNNYILKYYDILTSKYSVPDYKGKVLLLKASKTTIGNDYLDWNKTAPNITVEELDGGHNEIINNKETIIEYTKIINRELELVQNKKITEKVLTDSQ
ncbi:MAG: acyltransferase domain-containing protein [Prolixibacteraceae bacterium]|nr:acyltransferase domain-containing protein [Prolixibacteraceae bacterium]